MLVPGIWSTEMGCGPAYTAQDAWIRDFIKASPLLALSDDTLTLAGTETLVFIDREVADPDRTLAGYDWVIDTFIEGEAATNVNLDQDPTLFFDDDGTFEVYSGCNQGEGSYTTDGSDIVFSDLVYSEMLCPDKSAEWAEAHIQSVIVDGTATYLIDAARLTIEIGSLGVSAFTDQG